jgi:hypothetical protein
MHQLSGLLGSETGAAGSFIHTIRSRAARRSRGNATSCQSFVSAAGHAPAYRFPRGLVSRWFAPFGFPYCSTSAAQQRHPTNRLSERRWVLRLHHHVRMAYRWSGAAQRVILPLMLRASVRRHRSNLGQRIRRPLTWQFQACGGCVGRCERCGALVCAECAEPDPDYDPRCRRCVRRQDQRADQLCRGRVGAAVVGGTSTGASSNRGARTRASSESPAFDVQRSGEGG